MYYKVFIVTLAAVSVTSRPQSGNFQAQRQLQRVPDESAMFVDSFVRNLKTSPNTSSRRDAAANQFLNAEVRDIQTDSRRETTPKIVLFQYENPNTEVFVPNNLNPTEDNRNSAVTPNFNAQIDHIRSAERTSEFVNTNLTSNLKSKGFIKPLQTNQTRNFKNMGHRKGIHISNMQNNLTPNMTNFNQDSDTNTANSLRPGPQQNTQFAQNNNINYNQVPNIVRDNRTSSNPHDNETYITNPVYRSNDNNNNDQNRRTVNSFANVSNGRPSNSSFQAEKPVLANPDQIKIPEDDHNEDEDRWIWGDSNVTESGVTGTTGYSNVTESVVAGTTPDVDDRANFDGGSCPTGQAKIGTKCVDKD